MRHVVAITVVVAALAGCEAKAPTLPAPIPPVADAATFEARPVSTLPARLDPSCGNGRARLYDECGSQKDILAQALEEAQVTDKTVLVSFGAEWCIWCHVFDRHLLGKTGRFSYPVEGEDVTLFERANDVILSDANALNAFASNNVILVHIEGDNAPDGWTVMEDTGAEAQFDNNYPFIFSVTRSGQFAAQFEHREVERRRDGLLDWYRGYDRKALLAELQRMRLASQSQDELPTNINARTPQESSL